MTDQPWLQTVLYLIPAVTLLAVIQSVFGVGILLFGTPLLILLGVPFDGVLSLLLPCSLAISLLQVIEGRSADRAFGAWIAKFGGLGVGAGLLISLHLGRSVQIGVYVGGLLVLSGLLRMHSGLSLWISRLFRSSSRLSVLLIGLVHGATNMGGGLLTLFVASQSLDRAVFRARVAQGYLVFGAIQVAVLVLTKQFHFGMQTLLLPAITVMAYLALGRSLFQATSDGLYARLINALILIFGSVLILRSF